MSQHRQGIKIKPQYRVRKLKLGHNEQLDRLALAAGELYSRTLTAYWRIVRKKGIWLKPSSLMRWHNSKALHAHSADAVVQAFHANLQSWFARRKEDLRAKPPKRRKRYFKVQWKQSAMRLRDGQLVLANGRGNEPLVIPWQWDLPKLVEVGWDGEQYELRATYRVQATQSSVGDGIAGVDLGEIHLAVAHDGEVCYLTNGRLHRSKRRYQNKLKAKLQSMQDSKKKGSRRWKGLQQSKTRQLQKLRNQIRDIEHKQTTRMLSTLHRRGVQTVVMGDVRDLRQHVDYGKVANQKIHQMPAGSIRHKLTYKAEHLGIRAVLQDESYTSQTCPMCGKKHKPTDRQYICRHCGFSYHRDGVGAWNIRQKYLGPGPVVGVMASPTGMRYTPHMRCSS